MYVPEWRSEFPTWKQTIQTMGNYDLIDNGNNTHTLNLAVPGLRKEDLKLTVTGQILKVETISKMVSGPKVIHRGLPDSYEYKFDITGYTVEDAVCGDGILQILLSKAEKTGVIPIK